MADNTPLLSLYDNSQKIGIHDRSQGKPSCRHNLMHDSVALVSSLAPPLCLQSIVHEKEIPVKVVHKAAEEKAHSASDQGP